VPSRAAIAGHTAGWPVSPCVCGRECRCGQSASSADVIGAASNDGSDLPCSVCGLQRLASVASNHQLPADAVPPHAATPANLQANKACKQVLRTARSHAMTAWLSKLLQRQGQPPTSSTSARLRPRRPAFPSIKRTDQPDFLLRQLPNNLQPSSRPSTPLTNCRNRAPQHASSAPLAAVCAKKHRMT